MPFPPLIPLSSYRYSIFFVLPPTEYYDGIMEFFTHHYCDCCVCCGVEFPAAETYPSDHAAKEYELYRLLRCILESFGLGELSIIVGRDNNDEV